MIHHKCTIGERIVETPENQAEIAIGVTAFKPRSLELIEHVASVEGVDLTGPTGEIWKAAGA